MVIKNRYFQQCYSNAVKYVFQINEKENLVRTTKFKALHHSLHITTKKRCPYNVTLNLFIVYCVFYRFHGYQANKSNEHCLQLMLSQISISQKSFD